MVVYIQKTLHAKLYTMWGVWWARKRSLDCKNYPMTSALAHSSTPVFSAVRPNNLFIFILAISTGGSVGE